MQINSLIRLLPLPPSTRLSRPRPHLQDFHSLPLLRTILFGMLARLPVELLLHTLELAAPIDYSPSLYRQRQELLTRCCFVSKQLLSLAQPLLMEVVLVDSLENEVVERLKRNGAAVKLLCIQGDKPARPGFVQVDLGRILELCTNVVELRISSVHRVDLTMLSSLPSTSCIFHPIGFTLGDLLFVQTSVIASSRRSTLSFDHLVLPSPLSANSHSTASDSTPTSSATSPLSPSRQS